MKTQTTGRSATRDILVAVAIGIAGSLIVVPLIYLQAAAAIVHVYLVAASLGLWLIPCLLPLMAVRRPGASLIACAALGVVSALTSPFGPMAIVALTFEGLILELPFLVTWYRRWSKTQFVISGILFGLFMGTMCPATVGVVSPSPAMMASCAGIAVVFSLFGVWLCSLLAKRLAATGVLR